MNLGDGWCDDFNNVAECYFDVGDCCFNVNPQSCTKCECYEDGKIPRYEIFRKIKLHWLLKSMVIIQLSGGQTIALTTNKE